MKKSAIAVMLCVTLAFSTFVAGFYVGRNYNHSSVQISGITKSTRPSASSDSQQATVTTVPATLDAETAAIMAAINAATLEEWDAVPGIGETTAKKILEYRSTYGDFMMPEDMDHVDGIGTKMIEKIMDYFRGRLHNEDTGR